MKKVLITSFDMGIGGVERSLVNMLDNFDYNNYSVDLMLYRHQGEFLDMISDKVNLLDEKEGYNSFGEPLDKVIKDGKYALASARIKAKLMATSTKLTKKVDEIGYYQDQLANKYSNKYLDNMETEYDVAISYVWPHDMVAYKVKADKKIAWIHTDYSTIYVDRRIDLQLWNKFDYIVSISQECTDAFVKIYPSLKEKIILVENIRAPKFINKMANEECEDMIDSDDIKLLTVGRLCYPKAIDNAIKAMKVLRDKGVNNVKWYVVGYGPDEAMLKELIKENKLEDRFFLLGKKTNPYPYMKKCDIYIQPSRYEGKAVTVLEAQMLGKPVLITNYPTAKSQLNHNVDGYITDLSVNGIVKGIEKLINDINLRRKLEKNAKEFDYSNVEELEKLYEIIGV